MPWQDPCTKALKHARAKINTKCHSVYYENKINDNCYNYPKTINNVNIKTVVCQVPSLHQITLQQDFVKPVLSRVPSFAVITLKRAQAEFCN